MVKESCSPNISSKSSESETCLWRLGINILKPEATIHKKCVKYVLIGDLDYLLQDDSH